MTNVIIKNHQLNRFLFFRGIKLVSKSDSKLMKICAYLLKHFVPRFMQGFATSIGKTIYVPTEWDNFSEGRQTSLLKHELVHIDQYKMWWILYAPLYLLFPLPILFSYRYYFEREAYLVSLKHLNYEELGVTKAEMIDKYSNYLTDKTYLWAGKLVGFEKTKKWFEKEMKK